MAGVGECKERKRGDDHEAEEEGEGGLMRSE